MNNNPFTLTDQVEGCQYFCIATDRMQLITVNSLILGFEDILDQGMCSFVHSFIHSFIHSLVRCDDNRLITSLQNSPISHTLRIQLFLSGISRCSRLLGITSPSGSGSAPGPPSPSKLASCESQTLCPIS